MEEAISRAVEETDVLEEMEDIQEGKFLTFPLSSEEYGIEIKYVTEIVGIQKITEVPEMDQFIKGVINLRGKVIPVMDVRLRFDLEEKEYNERTCIIVVNVNNMSIGLIVDSVSEVIDIPNENIEPPTRSGRSNQKQFIKAFGKVGEKVKILLDVDQILFDVDLSAIVQEEKAVE